MPAPALQQLLQFLRARLADAIARGDDATAERLRDQLNALLNERRGDV